MTENSVLALYLRLSQEDRDIDENELNESNSITGQRAILRDFIQTHEEFAKAQMVEFCDDGYSGTSFDRPGVKNLIRQAKSGNIHCILVKDFSRFGRNYIEVGNYLEQVFPFLGIRFISVNDDFDSDKGFGAVGNIDVAFKNLIYDLYSKDLSEKAISGRNAEAQRGEYLAAYSPYGYLKVNIDGSKKIELDQEAAPIVRRIFEMADNGTGGTEIARILNTENIPSPAMLRKQRGENIVWRLAGGQAYWSGSTILTILRDKRYLGIFEYGKSKPVRVGSKKRVCLPEEDWITIPKHHEAIVPRELFDRVQTMFPLRAKVRHQKSERKQAVLSGKLRCAACGHALSNKKLKAGVFYFCNTKNYRNDCDCFKGSMSESELEKQILSVIVSMSEAVGTSPYLSRDQQKENLQEKKKQMKSIQAEIDRRTLSKVSVYERYKSNGIDKDAFLVLRKETSDEIEKLNHQIQKVELEIQSVHQALLSKESKINDALQQQCLSDTLIKDLVDVLIDTVYLNRDGSIKIVWSFADLFDSATVQKELNKNN